MDGLSLLYAILTHLPRKNLVKAFPVFLQSPRLRAKRRRGTKICKNRLFRGSSSLIGLAVHILQREADGGEDQRGQRHHPVEECEGDILCDADVQGGGNEHAAGIPGNQRGGNGTGVLDRKSVV